MPIARYYDESKNDGGAFDGVPLRDLTEDEFAALPAWLQASVDASPLYRKTKPRAEKAETVPDGRPVEPETVPDGRPVEPETVPDGRPVEPDRKRR